jgi:hypothetical protein
MSSIGSSFGFKNVSATSTDPVLAQSEQDLELYDQFLCNQVLQLSSMYMLSVIDKYMEM